MNIKAIDVIVPVVRDLVAARRCVQHILASSNTAPFAVVVIAAASMAKDRVLVLESPDANVDVVLGHSDDYADLLNEAFARNPERDVVVLQPDAEVHGDWLDRIAKHASQEPTVVAAFSHTAAAALYPLRTPADTTAAENVDAGALDDLFARVNGGLSAALTPLHGPCLYISRACLEAVGALRGFGNDDGRGSEIDFSLRSHEAGFATRVAGDVFVGVGGEDAMRRRTPIPGAMFTALANLHRDVGALRDEDRDASLRFLTGRVDLARFAKSERPRVVFVSHAWGGGIRRYMDDLRSLLRGRADVLYLEPVDDATIMLHVPDPRERFAMWFRLPGDIGVLGDTLRMLGVVRLHYQHVHALPRSILDLPAVAGIPYDCILHDYYAISPQYHLAGADGRYCGEPDEATTIACVGDRAIPWDVDVREWRRLLGQFVRGAERVIAPSQDVAARIGRYIPGVDILVWPHPEPAPAAPIRVVRVVTLGNLSPEKGLHVVAACAYAARRDDLPITFRVLGSTTQPIAQSPEVPVTLHGSYEEPRLARLLADEHADVLFFPAQVPETYSYTLSIALATPLPIVASSLGALPERLAERANARLVPWDAPAEMWNRTLLEAAGMTLDDEHGTSFQRAAESSALDANSAAAPAPECVAEEREIATPSPSSMPATLSGTAS